MLIGHQARFTEEDSLKALDAAVASWKNGRGEWAQASPATRIAKIEELVVELKPLRDEKILAVPSSKLTQRYDKVKSYSDLPEITLQQIQHFFEHYKDLEKGKWVKITRWGGPEEAQKLILEGIEREKKKKA